MSFEPRRSAEEAATPIDVPSPPKKVRVNVNFSPQAYDTLEKLAQSRGTSMSEVLRDAIALEGWFEDRQREGARILVERNGRVRELVRPR
jgi:hypothetical protein